MASQPMQLVPGQLSPDLLRALRDFKSVRRFPKDTMLFQQGSAVTGVYLVETGEVRILLPNAHRDNCELANLNLGLRTGNWDQP